MWWYKWRARLSYRLARKLFGKRWAVNNDRIWEWMQGQFARMAAFNDPAARSFYGHLLLHKGQDQPARNEGLRLLGLAANGGEARAAYQLGVHYQDAADPVAAVHWLELALQHGHPLAAEKLLQLYDTGGPPETVDVAQAERVRAHIQFF